VKAKYKLSSIIFSTTTLFLVGGIIYVLFSQLQENLNTQNIATGFSFLGYEAGFEISESLVDYDSFDTYEKALLVGFLNTIKMAVVGCFFAFFIGLIFGVMGISKKHALKSFAENYINIIRNIPLLLQLFFWYALFTDIFPNVKEAKSFLGVLLTNRGFYFPIFTSTFVTFIFIFITGIFLVGILYFCLIRIKKYKIPSFICLNLFSLWIITLVFNQLFTVTHPTLQGFNISGGESLSPEFCSLFLGLTIYTGAFMAEIIRSGILAIDKGQWEAGRSIGLNDYQLLRFIIIPQSFKVSLPPLISQFLNLTKNSSLAVAIGYPDFVSIANTSMNQTGQAIELVGLIMAMYLSLSLISSVTLNFLGRSSRA
jgi:general L-amino acid transport system permease protein